MKKEKFQNRKKLVHMSAGLINLNNDSILNFLEHLIFFYISLSLCGLYIVVNFMLFDEQ